MEISNGDIKKDIVLRGTRCIPASFKIQYAVAVKLLTGSVKATLQVEV
jgi:hypothetical protein